MASGRRSGDPTGSTVGGSITTRSNTAGQKTSYGEAERIFLSSMALPRLYSREVIGAGWDQVDINNYVLYYNSQVETRLAMPAPGLDISMKKAINTVIQNKVAGGTGRTGDWCGDPSLTRRCHPLEKLTEPDLGMISPGPRKTTVGGKPKPSTSAPSKSSTSAQLRLKPKPSARSVREAQEELKRVLAKKREEKLSEGSGQVGKEKRPESSKRWSEEALQISAGNCCPEADQAIPKVNGTFD